MKKSKKSKPLEAQVTFDLHGYPVEIAFKLCRSTLEVYRNKGFKNVEVITGKSGVIRKEFPFWMENLGYKAIVAKHDGSFIVSFPKAN
jgi:DNA-nicking Smr family endonuclease